MRPILARMAFPAAAACLSTLLLLSSDVIAARGDQQGAAYRSPTDLALSPDGKLLYVSDRTAGCVVVLDLAGRSVAGEIPVEGEPHDLALSSDGGILYVTERGAGTVAVIDTASRSIKSRMPAGRWPVGLALANDRLYVCNQDRHSLSVLDLSQQSPKLLKEIPLHREPHRAAVTPDEQLVVVTNFLPDGAAHPGMGAVVSLVDAASLDEVASIQLPPGSTQARGVCVSPDGRWAYVVHQLGRFNLPVTQLERGWVNTYALSLIDLSRRERLTTILLDSLFQGAANPHEVVCSPDGQRLWISHAGVHEISMVEIGLVHRLLDGKIPQELASLKDGTLPNVWVRIQQDPQQIGELENDLTALYIAGAIQRAPSAGLGPHDLALSPNGQLLVANYFSGSVGVLDASSGEELARISVGPQPEPDARRRGELLFHDATRAFQRWQSCASCHPNGGRTDGLRWDFLRDGMGNPKDTPSLVCVDKTEPLNRLATRETVRECARTGLEVSYMVVPDEEDVEHLLAYLRSLRPEPNPTLLPDGQLTEAAQRGKVLFEGKARCAHCHPAPYFADNEKHDVGAYTPTDPPGGYNTPTLLEAYRTAPYLHDGRAHTIRDVLTSSNEQNLHGDAQAMSKEELDDLIAYVLSL